ncbi:hypothetical protein NGB36_10145 [Streptomyces sp. RB6PN25]|uniref:Uncharacterized protein n=1 Tax=Streptomyces humicola TaxID=2953240 RepID=A0ABT1PVB0_9ACTN|nr:hypothetical protein [Streptomyces humicola]MCQ4080950.1 hypothetical protein [Streptomyces humicola]
MTESDDRHGRSSSNGWGGAWEAARTVASHGKTKKVWVKPHTVCTRK